MIEELTLGNFKCYGRRQTVRFTPGVNKISGRNASGKTTLLEAILFALFGEVPGVNKRDLIPLRGGKLHVSLRFESPLTGQKVRITREGMLIPSRRGVDEFQTTLLKMEVEGEERPYTKEREAQRRLRELLGLGKRTFFNVVYARQKEFVDILNPRRVRMDAILGLTTPAEIREQLREVRRRLEERGGLGERRAIEERIKAAEENIKEAERELSEISERRGELEEKLSEARLRSRSIGERLRIVEALQGEFNRLREAETELQVLRGRRRDREEELISLYKEIGEQPERRLAELQERRREMAELENRLQRTLEEELMKKRRGLDGEIATLTHQIEEHLELRESGLTRCPKCGQVIDHKLLEEDIKRWRRELEENRERLSDLEAEIEATQSQLRSARERRLEVERSLSRFIERLKRIEELRTAVRDLFEKGKALEAELEKMGERLRGRAEETLRQTYITLEEARRGVDEHLKELREEASSAKGEVRSLEALLEEAAMRRREIERRLEEARGMLEEARTQLSRIREYEAKISALERIMERYGEYEKELRDKVLRRLEWLTYKYFQRLTDQQVYSSCHIDRETYILEVQPIGAERMIPAWRAGGGHESLFALSERLALLRVMGFPHLLILDEPTDAVDSENIPQLLEYIARSGREIGQIVLVTHHGYGEEEGVNLIKVKRVDGMSRIYQEV
jgi:DNA repair exonuclease SbcCD ATPase subunit